jgi:hypothetical protein
MRYGIFSIDIGSCNMGNRLIEYSIKQTLGLPEPFVSISMFKACPSNDDIDRLNSCDFVIVPGATTLANGPYQADSLVCLPYIKVPVICVGAGSWKPMYSLNAEACKHMMKPIGVRDPQTLEECKQKGIEATLTGCPTLFLPKSSDPVFDYTVVGFAREDLAWQVSWMKSKNFPSMVASIQEAGHEKASALELTKNLFSFENVEEGVSWLAQSKQVVTGRLHSVLPAMSQDKPVCFFGNSNDSRFSLLSYLGITINKIGTDFTPIFQTFGSYRPKIEELKGSYISWARKLFGQSICI